MRCARGIVWYCLATAAVYAGTVEVSLNSRTVRANEMFEIRIEATGRRVDEPILPNIPGLTISTQPSITKTQAFNINGQASVTSVRIYIAVAPKPGTIKFPSIGVLVDGQMVFSKPFTLTVEPEGVARADASQQVAGDEWLFLSVETDKQKVYEGESIQLTLTLWALWDEALRVKQFAAAFPDTAGFYAIPREPAKQSKAIREHDGLRYETLSWKQTLYPTKSGTLHIGPWAWQGYYEVGRRPRPIELQSDPIAIEVKALPAPPDHFSGAVGQYSIEASLSKSEIIQGVPVELTVAVFGSGNPDAIAEPRLPEMPWAYVGDAKRRSHQSGQAVSLGGYDFVYSITPIDSGEQFVPSIEYCFFDPSAEKYRSESTSPLRLTVRSSAEPVQRVVVGETGEETENRVPVFVRDIMPIVQTTAPLRRQGRLAWTTSAALIAPAMAYAGLAVYVKRRRRFSGDLRYARSYLALTRARRRLTHVEGSSEPTEALYRAVTGFLADKFDVPEGGLTSADAERLLGSNSVPADIASGLAIILKKCERARYGGSQLTRDEVDALLHGAAANLERLNVHLSKAARA